MTSGGFDFFAARLRRAVRCALRGVFAGPRVRVRIGHSTITFHGDFKMQVPDSGGPFLADITGFVDAAGNPTTDTDVPVWKSSDETVATVAVADPSKPQEATVTLTKKLGQAQITADFNGGAANAAGGGFTVTGDLTVVAGAAVSATMVFSGPGVTAAPAGGGAPATGPTV